MSSAHSPREHIWLSGLVVVACVAVALWVLNAEQARAVQRVARADAALAGARALRAAQVAYREKRGEYGWLEELAAEGVLGALTVQTDDQGSYVESGGYRLEMLLPLRGAQALEQVAMVTRSGGVVDPTLRARHFAVVARPGGPPPRGYRTFYLDEGDSTWISEGVSDEEGYANNPLPAVHLGRSAGNDPTGLSWHRLESLRSDDP